MQIAAKSRLGRRGRTLYLCEPLEGRLFLSVIAINCTTSQDTIVISAHLQLGVRWVLDYTIDGGTTQHVTLSTLDSIAVNTVANSDHSTDTIDILASPPNGMSITGDLAVEDSLNLGQSSNGVQSVLGPITLFSQMAITLDDSADAAVPRHVSLTDTKLSGLAPGSITWGTVVNGVVVINPAAVTIKMGSFGGSTVDLAPGPIFGYPITLIGDSQGADDLLTVSGLYQNNEPFAEVAIQVAAPAPVGRWDLNVDDSSVRASGAIGAGAVLQNDQLDDSNGGNGITWTAGVVRSISLTTAVYGSLTIQSTDLPTSITESANSGVTIGDSAAAGVQQIASSLIVHGGVTFDDTSDSAARDFQLRRAADGTDVTVDGLAPATITYSGNASYQLWQNFDGGTVNILGAGQPSGFTWIEAFRSTTVDIGQSITVPDVQGTLDLEPATTGKVSLQVDDSADPVARNVTVGVTGSLRTGEPVGVIHGLLAAGDIDFSPTQTTTPLIINGGTGADTFTIGAASASYNATGVGILLNTGGGNDSVDIQTNPVTVNGGTGNDALTVDLTGITLPGMATFRPGPVTLEGGSGSNALTIIQSPTAPAAAVAASSIISAYQTTTFSHVSTLVLSSGTFTLAADVNGLNVSLAGASASMATTQHLGALSLNATGQATLASSAKPWGKTVFCTALSIAPGGKLDLTNNALQLSYTANPIASIRSNLTSGYAGGAWTGAGINSSTAAQDVTHATAIGYADSADGLITGLPANTLELKYTVYGDANLDGTANLPDLLTQVRHFGHAGLWDAGDFNFDNTIRLPDFVILVHHFGVNLQNAAIASVFAASQVQTLAAPVPLRRTRRELMN